MNIIKNADFSDWDQDQPCDWQISGGFPIADRLTALTGEYSLQIWEFKKKEFCEDKILSQQIKLTPHTSYSLNMQMYVAGSFFLKIRLIAIDTGKLVIENNMGWSSFLYWQNIPVKLTSASAEEYLLEIVLTSENKKMEQPVFEVDNINMTPEYNSDLTIFTHSIMQSYESDIPKTAIIQPEIIYQTAIQNEYHPLVIGLKTEREINSAQLLLLDSAELDFTDIKINIIKKQILAKDQTVALLANQLQRWWITITPTATAKPGIFRLKFKLIADDYKQVISLNLKVLAINLPKADIPMSVYFSERYMPVELLTDELRKKYYVDMREHGMNSATIYNNPDAENSDKPDFEHNWQFSLAEHQWFKDNTPKSMLAEEQNITARFNWGVEQEINTMLECGLCHKEFPVMWLVGKKTLCADKVDTWGAMASGSKIEQSIDLWNEHKNWPEPLYQVVDEPNGIEARIKSAEDIFLSLGNTAGKVRTITANVATGALGEKYDVWVQPAYKISEKYKNMVKNIGSELWVYDCATSNHNMAMGRVLFGFWAQLLGIQGIAQWAYYDASEKFSSASCEPGHDASFVTLSRVALSPNGPVATLSWEAIREGTIDFRVCKLFRSCYEKLSRRYTTMCNSVEKNKLKIILDQVSEVNERVLESIPSEVFAPIKAESLFEEHLMFKPAIGPGNPDLGSEVKRQALLAHIIKMENILQEK